VRSPHPPLTEPLFYCAALDDNEVVLTDDEAHHVGVQRLRAGDAIAVFDGRGQVARGTVRAIGHREVRVTVEQRTHEPRPVPRLALYSAVPKGDRLTVLLDMATQLGMSRFTPINWQRSVAEPGARAHARWQRICLEACKQSRRAWLPEIMPPASLAEAIASARAAGDRLIAAHPASDAVSVLALHLADAPSIALFVGPEGGMTEAEVEMLRREHARLVHLGPGILRIETAAVALLALSGAWAAARQLPERPDNQ